MPTELNAEGSTRAGPLSVSWEPVECNMFLGIELGLRSAQPVEIPGGGAAAAVGFPDGGRIAPR
jgi:hypothetical protein